MAVRHDKGSRGRVSHDGDNQIFIKEGSLREYNFYTNYLMYVKRLKLINFDVKNIESCRYAVNLAINNHYSGIAEKQAAAHEMHTQKGQHLLPEDRFSWIKNDERATFFIWAFLRNASTSELEFDPLYMPDESQKNWYKFLRLGDANTSTDERFSKIMNFFDWSLFHKNTSSNIKENAIEKLQNIWKEVYSCKPPLTWLPANNEDACIWVWSALQKKIKEMLDDRTTDFTHPPLPVWFTPLNHHDRYLAIIATFDLWRNGSDSKQLFMLNLNKAWNQRRLRQSRTDKKALNSYIRNETKSRLDKIAAHNNMRISDVLEKLINEHYQKIIAPD